MLRYDLDSIKYAIDQGTFEKAVGLYEDGKITKFRRMDTGVSAIVRSTHPYEVFVSHRGYDRGYCNCYLGQNDTLCKHMVAVDTNAVV